MLQAEEILNKVTKEVVIEIMEENGSPLYAKSKDNRTGQECLWFRTICHGGDSHKLCYFTVYDGWGVKDGKLAVE